MSALSQNQLKAFYEVAKQSSFTKAADSLGLTQSALSHRIKNLETELETSLFIRASDGIQLTEAGCRLLHYARIQDQLESEFINDFKTNKVHELVGTLKIAGASTLMWSVITPILGELVRSHKNIHIEFLVLELNELPNALQSGEADIIVSCGKPQSSKNEEFYLGDEINILVESATYKSPQDVYLDHDPMDLTTIQYLKESNLSTEKIRRNYFDDINGIIAGVKSGYGRAVIPIHLLKCHSQLRPVRGALKMKQPVYLCRTKQLFYTRLQANVIEVLKKEVPKFLSSSN
ncbi:MAG: LysR family transcriptional regulator [Pseudobdellovibrionaceae bacterium]